MNGHYVEPPYTVDAVNGAIRVNGRVVQPRPAATDPGGEVRPTPSAPQSAGDLLIVGANALRDRKVTSYDQITPQIRSDLVRLIKSYPAAALVVDEESSIVITDKAGRVGRLHLLVRPPTSAQEQQGGTTDMASAWTRLLRGNGVLLVTSSAAMEVAPNQAGEFLTTLMDAFAQPASARAAMIEKLVGASSISAALLAAGAPPAGLRPRIPRIASPQPTSQRSQAVYGYASHEVGQAVTDPTSHKESHTPTSSNAFLMHTIGLTWESAPVAEAARLQGYNVTTSTSGIGSGPGDVTVDRFLATSGQAGVLYLAAHGDKNSVSIEQYRFESDRDKALANYQARGIPVEEGVVSSTWVSDNYTVDINRRTIARWKGAQTIVELASCEGFYLADAFLASGAREVLATSGAMTFFAARKFNTAFWPRVGATQDNGVDRNVIDAYNASAPGTIFLHKGDGRTVLSPAVANYSPKDGATVVVGVEVKATVTFDVPMDTRYLPVWDLTGSCKPFFFFGPATYPGRIGWLNPRVFVFSFIPKHPGDIEVDVGGGIGIARGGENLTSLDGNQNPPHTDHVGPNGDPFKWHLTCVASSPGSVTGQSPTPTEGCSGQAKLFVDQFYPDAVAGGNPTPPTINTGGKRYCLTHIATYHWNSGLGAPLAGTLALIDAKGKVVDGGPWKAIATPGQGGVLANWEADISTTPPVILNGTYKVQDSDPSTWSWSKASGGFGFVRIWGIEYTGP